MRARFIDRLLALPPTKQVIVVDDGSTDKTPEILASYGDQIQVLTNPSRGGKGAAIRKALPEARGKVVILQDADLKYAPEEIPALIDPILKSQANVTFATRFSISGVRMIRLTSVFSFATIACGRLAGASRPSHV